jgi:hypothetical protein
MNGALLRVDDAGREHGQIRVFHNQSFDIRKVVPTVVWRGTRLVWVTGVREKDLWNG